MGRHRVRMPRWRGLLLMALVIATGALLLAPAIAAADGMPPGGVEGGETAAPVRPSCPPFGSTADKTNPVMVIGPAINVRAGKHPCYDRLVIDIKGPPAGWSAKYVDTFIQDASGQTLPIVGNRIIEFVVRTNGHDIDTGQPTLSSAGMPDVRGFSVFQSVILGADFEGQVQFGIGVRTEHGPPLPFRVFALAGTGGVSHVVLDVAHDPGADPR
jgi:hypothetical protein